MEIPYNITFHSNWHCGSGLASGAHLDALVIKDKKWKQAQCPTIDEYVNKGGTFTGWPS